MAFRLIIECFGSARHRIARCQRDHNEEEDSVEAFRIRASWMPRRLRRKNVYVVRLLNKWQGMGPVRRVWKSAHLWARAPSTTVSASCFIWRADEKSCLDSVSLEGANRGFEKITCRVSLTSHHYIARRTKHSWGFSLVMKKATAADPMHS